MRPVGNETGARMSSNSIVSARLLEYWQVEFQQPLEDRRRSLEAACERVGRGIAPASDLLHFALGDTDDDIVFRATVAHIAAPPDARLPARDRLTDSLEWIRRRLALNRAAVFAALLSVGGEATLEALQGFRLLLDDHEFEVVIDRMSADATGAVGEFLRNWSELRGASVPSLPSTIRAAA